MLIHNSPFARYLKPRYRGVLAADINSFGGRDPRLGLLARDALYTLVEDACHAAGIDWRTCYHEDRGDGLVTLVPPDESVETLIDPLVGHIRAGLGCYNSILASKAQIQLRIAIHAGHVFTDPYGISGDAVTHVFRLLQAPAFKARLTHGNGEVGVIASDHYYREIITYSPGQISVDSFRPIIVNVKETSSRAWTWLLPPLPREGGHNRPDRMIPPARCPGTSHVRAPRTLALTAGTGWPCLPSMAGPAYPSPGSRRSQHRCAAGPRSRSRPASQGPVSRTGRLVPSSWTWRAWMRCLAVMS
jgi:hypothetical protein